MYLMSNNIDYLYFINNVCLIYMKMHQIQVLIWHIIKYGDANEYSFKAIKGTIINFVIVYMQNNQLIIQWMTGDCVIVKCIINFYMIDCDCKGI